MAKHEVETPEPHADFRQAAEQSRPAADAALRKEFEELKARVRALESKLGMP